VMRTPGWRSSRLSRASISKARSTAGHTTGQSGAGIVSAQRKPSRRSVPHRNKRSGRGRPDPHHRLRLTRVHPNADHGQRGRAVQPNVGRDHPVPAVPLAHLGHVQIAHRGVQVDPPIHANPLSRSIERGGS
jgi:hypothetical protein